MSVSVFPPERSEFWTKVTGRLQPGGVDLFCLNKKFLVYNVVNRNLKVKYHRSVLGLFWTVLSPIAMTLVYYFVFKVMLKVQQPYYMALILSGVMPWTFFAQSLIEGTESLVGQMGLISKIPMPLQVFPFVGTMTNLITLLFSVPIILAVSLISHAPLGASIVLLPVYIGAIFLIAYSFALVLSILFVYFRDLRHFMSIILQIWFYATPVIYDVSMIPEKYRWILFLNPVGMLFVGLHKILVTGNWPSASEAVLIAAWTAVALFLAACVLKRCRSGLVEYM